MDIELIAKDLAQRSGAMAAGAKMSAKDALHPQIDAVVRQMLQAGSELMNSCAMLAQGPHDLAINILLRSVIELAIKAHWATMSADNADSLQNATREQFKTLFKVNAKRGIVRMVDRDGNDHTQSFLNSGRLDKGSQLPSIEVMADRCGLRDLYNVFYRFQSLHTHANDLGAGSPQTKEATLGAIGIFCILLGHIGVRWLLHRSRPDNEEIRQLLGLESRIQPGPT